MSLICIAEKTPSSGAPFDQNDDAQLECIPNKKHRSNLKESGTIFQIDMISYIFPEETPTSRVRAAHKEEDQLNFTRKKNRGLKEAADSKESGMYFKLGSHIFRKQSPLQ